MTHECNKVCVGVGVFVGVGVCLCVTRDCSLPCSKCMGFNKMLGISSADWPSNSINNNVEYAWQQLYLELYQTSFLTAIYD